MMGYYRRFVKDFAKIAKPLTSLLRGEGCHSNKKLDLTECEQNCFIKIKSLLSSPDILIYPDYSKPFLLITDASDFAIGAVLSQNEGENGKDILPLEVYQNQKKSIQCQNKRCWPFFEPYKRFATTCMGRVLKY